MLRRKSKAATKGKALCVKVQVVAEKPPAAIAAVGGVGGMRKTRGNRVRCQGSTVSQSVSVTRRGFL